MASQPESFEGKPSSFFTFCLNDFATKQSIPKAFEAEYRNFLLQESLQLKTIECDRRWDVKIKNIDGTFFIVDGWSDFVKDNNLLDMFFLVFRIVASSTLHVSVFDHDACLQLTPQPNPGDEGETTLRFIKELKNFNIKGPSRKMIIPKDFAESTEIATSNLIELEDESGRKWPISLTSRNNNRTGRYSMTGGWFAFVKGNNLQIGNILLFEFVPDSDSVVKVSVMEEGAGRELIAQAKYGGFLGERTVRRSLRTSLRFVKELKDFNFKSRKMVLPRGFAVGTGIATSNPLIVIDLEDESERKWPVAVIHQKNSGQYVISGGWLDFLKGNNHMQIGTILLFEFVPGSDNVVKVSAVEERAGRELLHQAGFGGLL